MEFQEEVQDLVYAIDENVLDYCILVPKYFPTLMSETRNDRHNKNCIRGQVRRFRENDNKIVIEILEKFDSVYKRYLTDLFDIFFEVNRMTYQLQHFALSFLKSENLFDILIDNKLYHQTPTLDAPQQNHNLK